MQSLSHSLTHIHTQTHFQVGSANTIPSWNKLLYSKLRSLVPTGLSNPPDTESTTLVPPPPCHSFLTAALSHSGSSRMDLGNIRATYTCIFPQEHSLWKSTQSTSVRWKKIKIIIFAFLFLTCVCAFFKLRSNKWVCCGTILYNCSWIFSNTFSGAENIYIFYTSYPWNVYTQLFEIHNPTFVRNSGH